MMADSLRESPYTRHVWNSGVVEFCRKMVIPIETAVSWKNYPLVN